MACLTGGPPVADTGLVSPRPPSAFRMPFSARAAVIACVGGLAACTFAPASVAAPSALSPQPAAVSFSDQDIHGGFHQTTSVVFTNGGGPDVTVSSVALAGDDPSQFNISNQDCNGATVGAGNSCQVTVEFVPTTRGAKSAILSIEDDSGTVDVPLEGQGITGTLTADPSPLVFNPQPWFFGGQQQPLNLNATPEAGMQTTSGTITGPDAALFYVAWGHNCLNQTYGAGTGCGMGIGFNPPAPGTFHAQLEITSDSASSPLVVPITATALFGPDLMVSPAQLAFGAVPVGQERTIPAVVTNGGDAPMQVQQLLFITGRPDVFFITGDACSAKSVDPGKSCNVLVHFKPNTPGDKDASLFFITGSPTEPVTPVGVNGTGVALPDGSAALEGRPISGRELTCIPTGFAAATSFRYQWLRNGREVAGATGPRLRLDDGDIGTRLTCRLEATNAVGARSVASAESGPVTPRELASQRHAFVDRWACRSITAPRALSVAGRRVAVGYGNPVTPNAPLTLRSRRSLGVSLDGRRIGSGKRVIVGPAALSTLADGVHDLGVTSGDAVSTARVLLAPCRLALRVRGGRKRQGRIAISALMGMRSIRLDLPRGLRLARTRRGALGSLELERAGLPDVRFALRGKRTRFNGVTVTLTKRRLRVSGLPSNIGVLRLRLRPGVLNGRGGTVRARAALMGAGPLATASVRSVWRR